MGRFWSITSSHCRGAQGVIFGAFIVKLAVEPNDGFEAVYDVLDRESFDALDSWIKKFDEKCDQENPIKLIVGA